LYAQSNKITTNQARWCIENYDKAIELQKMNLKKDSIINSQGVEIKLQEGVNKDNNTIIVDLNARLNEKDQIITNREEKIKDINKKNLGLKLQNIGLKIAIVVLVIIDIIKK